MESKGNGNGKTVDTHAAQQDISEAMLLQVMPRQGAAADLALLHALRSYVQEVVRQEVVVAVTQTGELLQNMIKFQVSKQMKDSGLVEQLKTHLVEELEDTISEKASEAGSEAASCYLQDCDFVSESDCEDIADRAAENKFSDLDYDDIAEEVVRNHLDTDELAETVKREMLDDVEDLVTTAVDGALAKKFRPMFVEDPSCCECGEVKPADEMLQKVDNSWWCSRRCAKVTADKDAEKSDGPQ